MTAADAEMEAVCLRVARATLEAATLATTVSPDAGSVRAIAETVQRRHSEYSRSECLARGAATFAWTLLRHLLADEE